MKVYVLDEHGEPMPELDLHKWAAWFETSGEKRRVANTEIGSVHISTVFLGLDHNYGKGPPLLYETMIFGGEHDGYQTRGSTRVHALKMHQDAVKLVKEKTIKLEQK